MTSVPLLPLQLRTPLSSAPSRLDRFQGAIAGAVLGYLVGTHYSELKRPHSFSQSLDLHWLFDAKDQNYKALFSYSRLLAGSEANSKTRTSAVLDLSLAPLIDTMIGVLTHCLTQGYTHQYQALQGFKSIPQNAEQAALVLLPLLMLHYDNEDRQRQAIAHILSLWSTPPSWEREVVALGATLSAALRSTSDFRSHPSSPGFTDTSTAMTTVVTEEQVNEYLNPNYSVAGALCECFMNQPRSYEIGIMALVNQEDFYKIDNDQATIAAMLGAFLGGYGGQSGLPLSWQHVLNQRIGVTDTAFPSSAPWNQSQSVVNTNRSKSLPLETLMQWSKQLVAVWGGMIGAVSDGHFTISSSALPTVTTPRALALD